MLRSTLRLGRRCANRVTIFVATHLSNNRILRKRIHQARSRATSLVPARRFEQLEPRWALSAVPITAVAFDDHQVFATTEPLLFSGEATDSVEAAHAASMSQASGTVSLSLTASSTSGRQALFSKDHTGYQEGGHLTVWVTEGRVEARLQSDSQTVTLYSATNSIHAGQEHHVAVGFGEDGFRLYVDGRIADARLDFTQGISENFNPLTFGVSTVSRQGDLPHRTDPLDGTINNFAIYDTQFNLQDIAALAGTAEVPLTTPTFINGVLFGTDQDDLLFDTSNKAIDLLGDYGDDTLFGTSGNNRLDGGPGQDRLYGGDGDDVLVSRSDGWEPKIDQLYGAEDDPHGEIDPVTRTLYSDQPIASDDMLVGGKGADTFRFEILINAKERILFKHTREDGTIDWKGVTGENRLVHDHWVDRIGDEVIHDFNRAEGDKIEVVGHTSDVYQVTHVDTDGDNVLDASVLYVQSNQGNAGAHNKDKLGTITVYGDLVRDSDYTVHAHANLGIVETIGELAEAMAPRYGDPVVSDGQSHWLVPEVAEEEPLPAGAVFGLGQAVEFTGEPTDSVEALHTEAMELASGTVSLSFTASSTSGRQALFSKDHTGYQEGGHLTVWVTEGRVEARLQSDSQTVTLYSATNSIHAGQEHHVAVGFGEDGFRLYVDGRIADARLDFTQGISENFNPLTFGVSTVSRQGDLPHRTDPLDGTINNFAIYDTQFNLQDIAALAGTAEVPLTTPTFINGVLFGTDQDDLLFDTSNKAIDLLGDYGDDTLFGTSGNNRLDGGPGQDRLYGGDGDDVLVSRSDGWEPKIDQLYGAEDDPHGEIDPVTRTLYSDQPIASDDMLVGGKGADTFRFEILINAKERILFKHTREDGTIDWKGVTGENRLVHDHWVDRIGDEVIHDFNRAEGDKIEVVGHTSDVYQVTHVDTDGDNVLDASVLYVQSNQGNAGAHNKDKLGTITVYGDLVRDSDYTVHAHANLGIVETIGELAEAMAPRYGDPVVSDGQSHWLVPEVAEEEPLPAGAVFGLGQAVEFTGEPTDSVEALHTEAMELASGTVSLSFTASSTSGRQALFSKDHTGYQEGGHLTVWVTEGRVEARLQSDSQTVTLYSATNSIHAGQEHHVAVGFGEDGFRLYVDGRIADARLDFTQGISENFNPLTFGVSTVSRQGDLPHRTDPLDGTINNFAIYDTQFNLQDIAARRNSDAVDLALAEFI